ncbi:MAG TPA: VCBS repeat-containing protein, partial [Chthonomonadaceae bacterium]|nr:VCBS repeat-containing protein [Chthonomonadaceae bacterium]
MKLSLPHKAFALFAIALPLVSLVGCRTTDSRIVALARDVPAHAATPAPQQAGPPIFVDVAESAGLHYRWQIAGKRPLNILQSIGNGCAFLDYDNDGFLDILLVGPKLALYKGDGKGHFTDVTAAVGLE